eukprot:TRINITY_DN15045_c1_g1_i2.p1 TRINITY_DN15045_c1_g1~~TRINITY_DN15045_c1_g1_i2.p1  ORF type:complete len:327 (-),score=53.70 TRINITY_DN15045_c1_g1_i2:261-1241(-)
MWRECLIKNSQTQLGEATAALRSITRELRASSDGFRAAIGHSRAVFEQHNADSRDQRAEELRSVAEEHQRRLEALRTSHAQSIDHFSTSRDQALAHVRRLHANELTALVAKAQQTRRETAYRLEQRHADERRSLEQAAAQATLELQERRMEVTDAESSKASLQQLVDNMRTALKEMTRRVDDAEIDAAQAREAAAQRESEVAMLQNEIRLLEVRCRAHKAGSTARAPAPPARGGFNSKTASLPGSRPAVVAGAGLSEELRVAIASAQRLELTKTDMDANLAELDELIAEQEKQVEVLEMEVEEERLRSHRLQTRLLECESIPRALS